jgi:16S rRNA (cytosine967-C5)-methyltransferase
MEKSKMIYHRHLVDQIVLALQEIFFQNKYADKTIEKNFKTHRKWGAKDRRFFAESVYECVRWWRKLWFQIGSDPSDDPQLILKVWGAYLKNQNFPLPQWPEFQNFPNLISPVNRAIQQSIPDWMDQLGEAEFKTNWSSILSSLNEKSSVDLRVNTLKVSKKDLLKILLQEEVAVLELESVPSGLTLSERKNVFSLKSFQSGFFEVQDRASQMVAPLLNPQPGERIIDACAGAGGKSLHLATLMQNKGKVLSLDIHQWKLSELKKRASRNGISIIETRLIENQKVIKRLSESADGVLLDVPCSGMGVLRRNPDSKWKLSLEEIERLKILQLEILNSYCRMVKPGGRMVYATCSILHSENEQQVARFLSQNPNWQLDRQLRINPDQGLGDGFFAALLKRAD